MSDIYESELNAFLRLNFYLYLITGIVSLSIKTSLTAWHGWGYFDNQFFYFLFPTAILLYSIPLAKMRNSSLFTKQCAIFIGAEVFILFIRKASYDFFDQRIMTSFLATGMVINYQAKIVTSSTAIFLVGAKHLIQWFYLDAILGRVTIHPFSIICTVVFLVIMHVQGSQRRDYINEIRQFKTSLKQTNKNMKRIMNTLQSGLVTFDKDFSIKMINPKALSLLHCSKDNFLDILSRLPFYRAEDSDDFVFARIQNQFSMEINSNVDLGSVMLSENHINLNLSKIDWGDEFIFVLLLTDVSATVNLERSILENELKLRFLYFIPHELRTPTVGILGCTENLLDSDPTSDLEQTTLSLKMILHSSRRLHSMICNISDYTQILSGQFSLSLSVFKLSWTIDKALEMVRSGVRCQNLIIRSRIDPFAPEYIETDHQRLHQVISILLYNSLKYTYKGFLEVIVVLENPERLRIEINDSGIGITPEKLAIIQQQLRSHQPGNLIFGLEVSDFIAQKLGGRPLSIASDKGTSVSLYVSLPTQDPLPDVVEDCLSCSDIPKEAKSTIEIRELSVSKTYSQVLIVDDTETSRAVLARILERGQISFVEARDGKEAVKTIKERDRRNKGIEVVIMDIDMPVMDGWEATKKIFDLANADKISKKPFVVGYSAFTAPSVIERAHDLGMISYIKKPARAQEILRVIKSLLSNE